SSSCGALLDLHSFPTRRSSDLFGFGSGGASERVILGCAFAFGEGALHEHIDGAAIFRVHADETIVLGGLPHGLEDGGVIEHEDAGIGHEELEAGDTVTDKLAHL